MFLRIGFTNWNIIEKYFRTSSLSSLSVKNDLLSLLCRVRVEAHFPLENLFISLRSLFTLSKAVKRLHKFPDILLHLSL